MKRITHLGKIWGAAFLGVFLLLRLLRLKALYLIENLLAGWTGLEPAASAVTGLCQANKLAPVFTSQVFDFSARNANTKARTITRLYGNIRVCGRSLRGSIWGKFGNRPEHRSRLIFWINFSGLRLRNFNLTNTTPWIKASFTGAKC